MALPQAVERAGQLADQMYEQAYGKQGEPSPAAAPPAAAPATPAAAPAAPPAAAPPADPPAAPAAESWEARYRTLAGKYNAEVPRMAAENRELKASVGELTGKVSTLSTQIAEQQSRVPVEPLIRPEEIQEFGEPLVDMSRRAGREAATQAVAPVQRELTEVRTELTDLKKSAAEIQWQNFIDLVTSLCNDWAQINVNPDFLTWLDGVDDFSGMTRQSLLDRAKNAHDAPRVARFFTTWKEANQNKATSSRNALAEHAVPDSSSRSVIPSGKPSYTRQQVHDFYSAWRAGRITDAEAIVTEAEINAAVSEGRIR